MNLLTTSSRDFLPKEKRNLIEQKEKVLKYRKRFSIFLVSLLVLVVALILFPQVIRKTVQPIYGKYQSADPVIKDGFSFTTVSGSALAQVLHLDNINSPQIAAQPRLAVLQVQQVNEQSVNSANSNVLVLHKFLVQNGSPAAGSAATFINVANEYGFDWRLLPAIADTESGLCRVIPILSDGSLSYNCFGFGIYPGSIVSFKSFDDAIQVVGKSLAATYGVKNMKPQIMEASYCPPCTSDHHWMYSVQTVMDEL